MKRLDCSACNATGWAHIPQPNLDDPFLEKKTDQVCPNCEGQGHYLIHDEEGVVNLIDRDQRWFTDRQWRLRRYIMRGEKPKLRQKWSYLPGAA